MPTVVCDKMRMVPCPFAASSRKVCTAVQLWLELFSPSSRRSQEDLEGALDV